MPTIVGQTAWVAAASASVVPAVPTNAALNVDDLLVICVIAKPGDVPTLLTNASFWTGAADGVTASGQAQGRDTGDVCYRIFYHRVTATTTTSIAPEVGLNGVVTNPIIACMIHVAPTAAEKTAGRSLLLQPWSHRNGFGGSSTYNQPVIENNLIKDNVEARLDDLFVTFVGLAGDNATVSSRNITHTAGRDKDGNTGTAATLTASIQPLADLLTTLGNDAAASIWSATVTATGTGGSLRTYALFSATQVAGGCIMRFRQSLAPLPPPTALTATVDRVDSVFVNWDPVAGADGYVVGVTDISLDTDNGFITQENQNVTEYTLVADYEELEFGKPKASIRLTPESDLVVRVATINADGVWSDTFATAPGKSLQGPPKRLRLLESVTALSLRHYSRKNYAAEPFTEIYHDGVLVFDQQGHPVAFPLDLVTGLVADSTHTVTARTRLVHPTRGTLYSPYSTWTYRARNVPVYKPSTYNSVSRTALGSAGVKLVGGTTVAECLDKPYLVEPDKSKYVEFVHQSGNFLESWFDSPLDIAALLDEQQVFDIARGVGLAFYMEGFYNDPTKYGPANIFLQARYDEDNLDMFTFEGTRNGTIPSEEFGGWTHLYLTGSPTGNQGTALNARDFFTNLRKLANRAAARFVLSLTHQAFPNNNAPTGSVITRLYALALVVPQRPPTELVNPVTATYDKPHQIIYTVPAQPASARISSIAIINKTDTDRPDGQSDGFVGSVNASTTTAQIIDASPSQIYEPGTYFPFHFLPDDMRADVRDLDAQSSYRPCDAGLPLPSAGHTPTLVLSGDAQVTVSWQRPTQGYDTKIWRARVILGKVGGFEHIGTVPREVDPPIYPSNNLGLEPQNVTKNVKYVDSGLLVGATYEWKVSYVFPSHGTEGPISVTGAQLKVGRIEPLVPNADLAKSGLITPGEYVLDTFNRPDANTWGPPWTAQPITDQFGAAVTNDSVQVFSNRGHSLYGITSRQGRKGDANGELQVTWYQIDSGPQFMWWRGTDGQRQYMSLTKAGDIHEPINDSTVQVIGNIGAIVALDVIKVVFNGTTTEIYRNGTLAITFTSSFGLTRTHVGLLLASGGAFDDFSFLPYGVLFDKVDDGYASGDATTWFEVTTNPDANPESVIDFALSDPVNLTRSIDPNGKLTIYSSVVRPKYPTSGNVDWPMGSHELQLWQGAPGTGVLVAKRWISRLVSATTHDAVMSLLDAERDLITDPAALTMRVRTLHIAGVDFSVPLEGTQSATTVESVFYSDVGGHQMVAREYAIEQAAGRIALTGAATGGNTTHLFRYGNTRAEPTKPRYIVKFGSGATNWRLHLVGALPNTTSTGHGRLQVGEAGIDFIERTSGGDVGRGAYGYTAATKILDGREFEFEWDRATGVMIMRDPTGALLPDGTSEFRSTAFTNKDAFLDMRIVNKHAGTSYVRSFKLESGGSSLLTRYRDFAYGIPVVDPNEKLVESEDLDTVSTSNEVVDKPTQITDTDSATATVEKTKMAKSEVGTLVPDAILAVTNMTGPVENIQNDPAVPDNLVIEGGVGSTDLRTSFQNPDYVLVGEQKFRLRLREPL